jgi:hypothetical protein
MEYNQLFNTIKEHLRNITLSDQERFLMKENLLSMIDSGKKPQKSPIQKSYWMAPHLRTRMEIFVHMTIAILVVSLTGGIGLVAAAEASLPGQALYGIKIGLNEEFRSWAAPTLEKKIDWEIKRAERRFNEATVLAIRGELKEEETASIASNITKHTKLINERASEEDPELKREANMKLGSSLKAHSAVLSALADSVEEETKVKEELKVLVELAEEKVVEAEKEQEEALLALKEDNTSTEEQPENPSRLAVVAKKEYEEIGAMIAVIEEQISLLPQEPEEEEAIEETKEVLVEEEVVEEIPEEAKEVLVEEEVVEEIPEEAKEVLVEEEVVEEMPEEKATEEEIVKALVDTIETNLILEDTLTEEVSPKALEIKEITPEETDTTANKEEKPKKYFELFETILVEYDQANTLISKEQYEESLNILKNIRERIQKITLLLGLQIDSAVEKEDPLTENLPADVSVFDRSRLLKRASIVSEAIQRKEQEEAQKLLIEKALEELQKESPEEVPEETETEEITEEVEVPEDKEVIPDDVTEEVELIQEETI